MRLQRFLYFILTGVLVHSPLADSNSGSPLSEVSGHRRASYAQKLLGSREFKRLADWTEKDVAVEQVVFDHVVRAKKGLTKVQTRALTETIIRDANKYKMDPLFVLAIIEQESRFNPMAVGGHGEIGLMQIMPKTALWTANKYGIRLKKFSQLHDPILNVRIGIRYFDWLNRQFNNVKHSTSAYNMGVKNVQKILAKKKQPLIYFSQVLERYKRLYEETNLPILTKGTKPQFIAIVD
jgi:soluble lytic murein transglycosylase